MDLTDQDKLALIRRAYEVARELLNGENSSQYILGQLLEDLKMVLES